MLLQQTSENPDIKIQPPENSRYRYYKNQKAILKQIDAKQKCIDLEGT